MEIIPLVTTIIPSTVTVNVSVTMLDASSVAVYVTTVEPMAKAEPGLWLDVSVTTPELSEDVGSVHVTTAVDKPLSVFWVILDGVLAIAGSSLSRNKEI